METMVSPQEKTAILTIVPAMPAVPRSHVPLLLALPPPKLLPRIFVAVLGVLAASLRSALLTGIVKVPLSVVLLVDVWPIYKLELPAKRPRYSQTTWIVVLAV